MSRVDPPDWVAVARAAVDPAPPIFLSRDERRLAGLQLLRRGESAAAVAARLGVASRTAERWRAGEAAGRKRADAYDPGGPEKAPGGAVEARTPAAGPFSRPGAREAVRGSNPSPVQNRTTKGPTT